MSNTVSRIAKVYLDVPRSTCSIDCVKQRYHTIIKPQNAGWFVGWVEEIPGTITHGKSLEECRQNLKDSLRIMLETHRDEARQCLDDSCIQESIEIDVIDSQQMSTFFA